MIEISIIIVSWNTKDLLHGCIKSIYETAREITFELIVVDNNSSDGSVEMVQKEFSDVKLICNRDNLGFAKANNIGIRASQGKYICLINSDVVVLDNCIDTMFKYMESNPGIGISGPKILNSDKTLQRSFRGFPTLWNTLCRALALDTFFPQSKLFGSAEMTYFSGDRILNVDILSGAFWFIRCEPLKEVGLLDENYFMYSEDKDWCKRFKNTGWEITYFPHSEIIHHGGGSSSHDPIKFYIEYLKANFQYWEKHHNYFAQVGFFLIMILHTLLRITIWIIQYVIVPCKRKTSKYNIKKYFSGLKWLIFSPLQIAKIFQIF